MTCIPKRIREVPIIDQIVIFIIVTMNIRSVKFQTFTKTFEGLGEMTAISTSEKKCMSWNKHIDLGLWSNVKVIAHRVLVENPDLLAMVSKELRLAEQNIAEIIAAIKEHDVYKEGLKEDFDPLVPNAFITAELNQGESGNLDPYVAVFYGSDKYFVWFSIQDGKITEFTMRDSNETV